MDNEEDPYIGKTIDNKYKILKKLGKGSYFETYKAEYLGDYFAIKFGNIEKIKNMSEILSGLVCQNIPYIKEISISNKESYIVTQLFGKNINELKKKMKKLSVKTTAMIGYQILHILEIIHAAGIVHRNLGPANIVIGCGDLEKKIFLIGFSFAKKFKDNNGNLLPMKYNDKFCGIAFYASINSLNKFSQCRRDDLESLGYILVELLKGKLPWKGKGKMGMTPEEKKEFAKLKQSISAENLCEDLPIQMKEYINYCRNLEYEDIPDYEMLKKLFMDMITKNNEVFDYVYDWSEKKSIDNNNFINNKEIENLKSE